MFKLPDLPYAQYALEPYISARTLSFHYGKHHKAYVDNLNELVRGTDYTSMPVEDIIKRSDGKIYNNAAQAWNHTFYWYCMAPQAGDQPNIPKGNIAAAIEDQFGGFEQFREQFTEVGKTHFGSGWAWLTVGADKKLVVSSTPNQDNPLMDITEKKGTPVLGLDVWEHAYYLHYQNRRADYVTSFFNLINWREVTQRYNDANPGRRLG